MPSWCSEWPGRAADSSVHARPCAPSRLSTVRAWSTSLRYADRTVSRTSSARAARTIDRRSSITRRRTLPDPASPASVTGTRSAGDAPGSSRNIGSRRVRAQSAGARCTARTSDAWQAGSGPSKETRSPGPATARTTRAANPVGTARAAVATSRLATRTGRMDERRWRRARGRAGRGSMTRSSPRPPVVGRPDLPDGGCGKSRPRRGMRRRRPSPGHAPAGVAPPRHRPTRESRTEAGPGPGQGQSRTRRSWSSRSRNAWTSSVAGRSSASRLATSAMSRMPRRPLSALPRRPRPSPRRSRRAGSTGWPGRTSSPGRDVRTSRPSLGRACPVSGSVQRRRTVAIRLGPDPHARRSAAGRTGPSRRGRRRSRRPSTLSFVNSSSATARFS